MLESLKKFFYFPLSYYFRFFAKLRLGSWKPNIIVITGSSGKTTLLHLIESQIGDKARYSHHANSTYGIPFDILGLKRKQLKLYEWIPLILLAPLSLLKLTPKETLYIVEADTDRPGEGRYIASLLEPNITLWTNSSRTHSMNFDKLVDSGKFSSVEEAIAYDFGYFLEYSRDLVIVNGDSSLIEMQFPRTKAEIKKVKLENLSSYEILNSNTTFKTSDAIYKLKFLLPKEFFYSLHMTILLLRKLDIKSDLTFSRFRIPPGRNNLFKGIKNTTIVDSSYNANLDSMTAILNMFDKIKASKKWIVIGDMLEQGKNEKEEHEKLADIISKIKADKIMLMGPRVSKYTLPLLSKNNRDVIKFLMPNDVLSYIKSNIKGEEVILFKGARFLEGVVENLLKDKKEAAMLARREKIWDERRRKFGL